MNHKKTENDKDILKTLIATVPTTLTMFSKEIGVNPASLRNVAAGRTDLSEKVKCKIIQKYPNTNREFLDYGIGDVFVKNQIDAMGGTIKAESKLGEGTTFIIGFK